MDRMVVVLLLTTCVILGLAFIPWVAFWAIGVLFGHHVEVTFRTWLAAWVLLALVGNSGATGNRS